MDKVIVIAGPTASGKSAYSTQLAQKHHGVIINADSIQVYQCLEILTAQPSREIQREVPHRLYSILPPTDTCSAGQWVSLALEEIKRARESGKLPLVVGGTGLYLKSLMEGLSSIPSCDPKLREQFQDEETSALYNKLKSCDPTLAERLKPQDRQRIIRGLEVWHGTGKSLSFWQNQKPSPPPYNFETHLLMPSKAELIRRFQTRLEDMLVIGVLEEVEKTMPLTLSPSALKAIGLKELREYIEGQYSLEKAKELILLRTQQYAKRQKTWFRHQLKANHAVIL